MKPTENDKAEVRVTMGSGNVLADIGIPEPEEALAKARLADMIGETIEDLGLTQAQAGKLLGIDQGTVSKIINDRLDGFSQERLIRYLTVLGNDVEILVRRVEESGHPGTVSVGRG